MSWKVLSSAGEYGKLFDVGITAVGIRHWGRPSWLQVQGVNGTASHLRIWHSQLGPHHCLLLAGWGWSVTISVHCVVFCCPNLLRGAAFATVGSLMGTSREFVVSYDVLLVKGAYWLQPSTSKFWTWSLFSFRPAFFSSVLEYWIIMIIKII